MKKLIKQFIKFSLVGIINTLINLAIFLLLTEIFEVYYILSAVFAFLVAVTNSFVLNKIWTFKENLRLELGKKYLRFGLVSVSALLVNLFFLYIFTEVFGIYYIISQILAIGISLIINFIGNKIWTFNY